MGRYLKYLHSDAWQGLRAIVFMRCSNICEVCKLQPAEEVHHKTYENLFREPLDDLLGVCSYCHEKLHGLTEEGGDVVAERWRALPESDEIKQRLEDELERFLNTQLSWKYWKAPSDAKTHDLRNEMTTSRRFLYGRWECELVGSNVSGDDLSVRWRVRVGGMANEIRLHNVAQRFRSGTLRLDCERQLFVDVGYVADGLRILAGKLPSLLELGLTSVIPVSVSGTVIPPPDDPAIEVPRLVGTIYDLMRRSRDGWLHWNRVALKCRGSECYGDLLMGYAELPEWRKLFALGRGGSVKLTSEGIQFAKRLLSDPTTDTRQDNDPGI